MQGSLFDGARAWFYSIVEETGVSFIIPFSQPSFCCCLSFFCWFLTASGSKPLAFLMAHLEKGIHQGDEGVPMGASDVRADLEETKKPMGSDLGLSVELPSRDLAELESMLSEPPLGKRVLQKKVVSKSASQLSSPASKMRKWR